MLDISLKNHSNKSVPGGLLIMFMPFWAKLKIKVVIFFYIVFAKLL